MRVILYIISAIALMLIGCTNYYEVETPSGGRDGGDGGDSGDSGDNDPVTVWMDEYLSKNYLYNSEYNALDRDLTTSWDEYLDATLTQLGDNLDYKNEHLYSFIYRTETSKAETRISESKVLAWSFGVASIMIDEVDENSCRIAVMAVYEDSPMYDAGIRRGDFITKVNNRSITSYTMAYSYASYLAYPSSATSYSLTINDEQTSRSVTAKEMYCSSILHTDYYGTDDKVGYISYLSFDAAYDNDLLAVMKEFKDAGVTDVILDMRLNGGGYVDSANKLSTAIGGSACSGKVFTYYEYNSSRGSDVSAFMSSLSSYHLSLTKLYCIVSGYTASASELVINSLRGIDFEVILIGSTTNGKNVGMEVPTSGNSFGGYDYYFAPITFKLSNAKEFSDYENGFEVDCEADDWGVSGENFSDFSQDDILIAAALNHISTGSFTSPTAMTRATSTGVAIDKGQTLFAPSRLTGNIVNH